LRHDAAPEFWQSEAGIAVDQVGHRRFELGRIYVLSIDPAQRLGGRNTGSVAGSLARAEIAAIAEHGGI